MDPPVDTGFIWRFILISYSVSRLTQILWTQIDGITHSVIVIEFIMHKNFRQFVCLKLSHRIAQTLSFIRWYNYIYFYFLFFFEIYLLLFLWPYKSKMKRIEFSAAINGLELVHIRFCELRRLCKCVNRHDMSIEDSRHTAVTYFRLRLNLNIFHIDICSHRLGNSIE